MGHIPEQTKDELMELPGVTAVGEGGRHDNTRIVVFVEEKTPDILNNIPLEFDGFDVVVKKGGQIGLEPLLDANPEAVNDGHHRPVRCGVSTGPAGKSISGTLGWIMTDGSQPYMVSNYHVYTAVAEFDEGEPIVQPSMGDGGEFPSDRVGEIADFIPYNEQDHPDGGKGSNVDVAWASIDQDIDFEPYIHDVGKYNDQPVEVEEGDEIIASGRTSGVGEAEVLATNATTEICIAPFGEVKFFDLIFVENWSDSGDSGSPYVLNDGEPFSPVGLHFAGGDDISVAVKMSNVIEETGLEVLAEGGTAPPSDDPDFNVENMSVAVDENDVDVTYELANNGQGSGSTDVKVSGDIGPTGTEDVEKTVSHSLSGGESDTNTVEFSFNFDDVNDVNFCVNTL